MTIGKPPSQNGTTAIILALIAAIGVSAGSLWLTFGMGLTACPLCLYQRLCVLAAAGILFVGVFIRGLERANLAVIVLPVVVAGIGVAGFHNYLELKGTLECPGGIGGVGSAPQQALFAQVILLILLLMAALPRPGVALLSLCVGAGIAFLLIQTSPPLPKPKPPEGKFDMCRPVYVAPKEGS